MTDEIIELTNDKVSKKSRLTVTLFSGFLGMLGAHDFYAGKILRGIIKVILCLLSFGSFNYGMITISINLAEKLSNLNLIPIIVGLCGIFACGIWQMVDFILCISGKYSDKNGKKITKWETEE